MRISPFFLIFSLLLIFETVNAKSVNRKTKGVSSRESRGGGGGGGLTRHKGGSISGGGGRRGGKGVGDFTGPNASKSSKAKQDQMLNTLIKIIYLFLEQIFGVEFSRGGGGRGGDQGGHKLRALTGSEGKIRRPQRLGS